MIALLLPQWRETHFLKELSLSTLCKQKWYGKCHNGIWILKELVNALFFEGNFLWLYNFSGVIPFGSLSQQNIDDR